MIKRTIKPWRNFKYILLAERSWYEKAAYCVTPTIGHSGTGNTVGTLKRSMVASGWRERKD